MMPIPLYLYKTQNVLSTQTHLVLSVSDRYYGFIVLCNKMSLINKTPPSVLKGKIIALNPSMTFLYISCWIDCKMVSGKKEQKIDSCVDWEDYTFHCPYRFLVLGLCIFPWLEYTWKLGRGVGRLWSRK